MLRSFFLNPLGWLGLAACALGLGPTQALASSEDAPHAKDLVACYQQLSPYTTSGLHAAIHPSNPGLVFIPGKYEGKSGLFVYSDRGAGFTAIDDEFSGKTVSFKLSATQSVIYQPASSSHPASVWLRQATKTPDHGVAELFKDADDPEKRSALEAELDLMIQGMAPAWDNRQDMLVQSVTDGKYLWVEVDLDKFKNALAKCRTFLGTSDETSPLQDAMKSENQALTERSSRTGVVKNQSQKPNQRPFMASPQY